MTIEQKSWLTTITIIIIGYILLRVPIINLVIEGFILITYGMFIYESIWDFYYKEENKKHQKDKK